MRVSIITAAFNSASTIKDCIESVNNQEFNIIEHIVIDGKSTDNTIELINENLGRVSTIISEPDNGIYDAMNKGIRIASGDIIGILNSDDFYEDEQVISDVVNIFKKEKIDAVYADLDLVAPYDTNKVIRKWRSGPFKHTNFLWGWMPPHPTLFLKREVYEKYGNFNLSLKTSADYEIMLRFFYKHKIKVAYLPRVIIKMRTGGFSDSSISHRFFANKEDRLAWEINGLKPYFFTTYLKPLRKIFQYL